MEPLETTTPRPEAPRTEERRFLWTCGGLGVGIAVGLLVTVAQAVSQGGWGQIDTMLPLTLMWSSYLGFSMGRRIGNLRWPRAEGQARPPFQLRTRTLMVLVAIVGLAFGLEIGAIRVARPARLYRQNAINFAELEGVFHKTARQLTDEANQTKQEARLLREEKIPESLLPTQKDFLRSLDAKASPEYRRERYKIMADSAEEMSRYKNNSAQTCANRIPYYKALAAKYRRAAWRPWLRLPPDPPQPQ